MKSTRI